MQYKAGYVGKEDPMRNKARQMMKGQGMDNMSLPESASSRAREKVRLYKKGGGVKIHRLNKEQTDLKLPRQHMKAGKVKRRSELEAEKYRNGGTVYEKQMRGEHRVKKPSENIKVSKTCYADGGEVQSPMDEDKYRIPHFKKGGKKKLAGGGALGGLGSTLGGLLGGLGGKQGAQIGSSIGGLAGGLADDFLPMMFKKGGKVKKASGGTIYESQMNGTRRVSSDRGPIRRNNYEKPMPGEHQVGGEMRRGGKAKKKYAGGGALGGLGSTLGGLLGGLGGKQGAQIGSSIGGLAGGLADDFLPMMFNKGGRAKGRAKSQRMAIGGSGKIRHKEATAKGMPIKRKVVKGR